MYRTHDCNSLRKTDIGKEVTLAGWVNVTRDHGGVIFIDLRDREGLTQVVFRPEENAQLAKEAHSLRGEDVIEVSGRVAARPAGTENTNLATGDIEVIPSRLRILNRADTLPFPIDAEPHNEDLRMTHRYFDLRRPGMARNLRLRHRIMKATRDYLDGQGYVEVETPILSKSTPEGARDFLVPSRLTPGKFYALPQAPQQYKQLLMVAGVEKYFQIAKCFRDEDFRADRQPEFTQIDIEASFVTPDDIFAVTEGMLAAIFKIARNIDIKTPFDRLTYQEAVGRYGSDKPDRRFGMELVDLGDDFRSSSFKVFRGAIDAGGVVKAINAKGFAGITIGQADELTEIAKLFGAKGLAFIKVENGEWKSPIVKFFSEAEKTALQSKLEIEEGDCIFFGADKWEIACEVLGRLRLRIAEIQKLIPKSEIWDFLWVTDFPLFQWSPEENKWNAMHHPFTRPKTEDIPLFEAKNFPERRGLRRRPQWRGDRRRQHSNSRARTAGKNVRNARRQSGRSTTALRPFAARIASWRAAARRYRARPRSACHARLWRAIHPRCDGVPKKQSGHGFDVEFTSRSRFSPAARTETSAVGREKMSEDVHSEQIKALRKMTPA